ncbi:hypothetical protein LOTGIDRAFT_175076 [Lottia gigantea]|uniref:Peptidase S1 domain-containing protein n=1 Tax=Lottia gigantea TaxID=225164 RepID=V3ZWJ6_LOTGI|nr:hypothetical protein LOTGIDRAFT_175076 [Lottia gigantea]ESO95863.1 hypothetical protein LOTGIDRAFT_175076 [Lottia gigantea]
MNFLRDLSNIIGRYTSGSLRRSNSHICGGSLVKSQSGTQYYITAAHCVYGGNANSYSVKFGSHFRTTSESGSVTRSVSKITMHPNYNAQNLRNDIAVLTLSSQVTESDRIKPICWASRGYTNNEEAIVIGWGTLTEGGSSPNNLQEVSKPILSTSSCSSLVSGFDSNTMLCSGLINGGKDACQGDSGGPLFTSRGGIYELTGVVSWGYGCARPNNPGVYADTYKLGSWVDSIIN